MDMFKTNNKISSEAETLYAEHKSIHGAVAKNTEYVDSAKRMLDSMIESKAASDEYVDNMHFDIQSVKIGTGRLETKAAENVVTASEYVRTNPRIFDIAVKTAMRDGVEIKTK